MNKNVVMGLALMSVGCVESAPASDAGVDAGREVCATSGLVCEVERPGTVCCQGLCLMPADCPFCSPFVEVTDTRRDAFVGFDAGCSAP